MTSAPCEGMGSNTVRAISWRNFSPATGLRSRAAPTIHEITSATTYMDGVVPDRTLLSLCGGRLNGSITSNLQITLIGFSPSQIALDVIVEPSRHLLRFLRMCKKIDHRLRESMFVADINDS